MRNIDRLAVALLAFVAWNCSDEKTSGNTAAPGESYKSFTDDGAWCWFSDPRAIYHHGKHRRTYSGWVDSAGNIVAGFYDHDNGEVRTFVLHEKFEKDDHDNPSFFLDRAGKMFVFYSRHSTGNSPVFLARSRVPEDISQWEPLHALRLNDTIAYAGFSNTYTYTNIAALKGELNKMYLFWRGADFKPNVSTSADTGRTWTAGKILVLPERIYRDRRPYLKIASDGDSKIHFAFTDGHPNAEPTNSIYYMRYRDGAFYKANDSLITDWQGLPVDPAKSDIVYNATRSREKAWIWDVAQSKEGNPVIVFATFPSDTSHVYYYSIHDGERWNTHRLLDAGPWFPHTPEGARERESNYSGGIVLDHEDPSHVYLSREANGVFEIEHWSTRDEGQNWSIEALTSNSVYDNVRPFVVRNHPEDSVTLLWMNIQRYVHYTDYRGAIKIARLPSGQ